MLLKAGDFLNSRKIKYIEYKEIYGDVALIFFEDSDDFERIDLANLREAFILTQERYEINKIDLKKL